MLSSEITLPSACIKLSLSFALGLLVGIERQSRRQVAGLRTFALISTASTAAMMLSIWIPQTYPHLLNGDPGRIAAQILTGIGFLGAGAIIQGRGSVYGLTTAASIWLVAIVGMCVGGGMYGTAVLLTALALFILSLLSVIERRRTLSGENKELLVEFDTANPDLSALSAALKKHGIYTLNLSISKHIQQNNTEVHLRIHVEPLDPLNDLFADLQQLPHVTLINLQML